MSKKSQGRGHRKGGAVIIIRSAREKREPREKRVDGVPATDHTAAEAVEPAPEEVRVTGLSDQNRSKWILVSRGELSAVARVASIEDQRSSMWRELSDQGLLFTRSKTKQFITNEIEDIREWPQAVYVATRPGYHCGAFVRPDGAVIGDPQAQHFRAVLAGPPVALGQGGTLQSWKKVVRTFAQGQVVYTTLACAAFVGPILELFPNADNVCLLLVGDTSGGKTTGLDLYCSAWGAPHQQPGSIGISLRSTSAGLEQQMMARSAAAFAADEVNLLGRNTREQGDRIYDLAFMVSHGVEKEKFNDPARVRIQQSFLATSNTSLARLLDGQDEANAEAVLARFLTIPAEAGAGLGVFDSVPEGFDNSRSAVDALKDALVEHHGSAADAFLAKLALARRTDEAALRAKLQKYCTRFLSHILIDPLDRAGSRRARSFGLIYAAARLAKEWRILPLKRLTPLLLESYRRSAAADVRSVSQVPLSAQQRVQAYVEANNAKLRDLDVRKPARISLAKLDRRAGFLKTVKQRRCLLIRSKRWEGEFRADAHRLLKHLRHEGRLYATKGLQAQVRVRADRSKDRVYCVILD